MSTQQQPSDTATTSSPASLPAIIRRFPILEAYYDSRIAKVFLLGVLQGLPWVMISPAMTAWLKEGGLSRTDIGLFSLVFSVYSINFLWAPLLDKFGVPFLGRFGQRRSWVLLMQCGILLGTLALFFTSPVHAIIPMAALCLGIAICSATQDVSLDAFRIELFGQNESSHIAAAAAVMTAGWWTSFKMGGALAFYSAHLLQQGGMEQMRSWQWVYLMLAGLVVLTALGLRWTRETSSTLRQQRQQAYAEQVQQTLKEKGWDKGTWTQVGAWLYSTVVLPLTSFFRQNGVVTALLLLGFITLFKAGEAFMGRMADVFYLEVGFSKAEIAFYSKTLGWIATIVFALCGGLLNARFGLLRSIFISGIAMAATNLLFALMALQGTPHVSLFAVAVITDQFTTAVATVTFVAFISQLCDRAFSATQYALMASLATFARNSLAALSGGLVDKLDGNWALFFTLTAFMVVPSLLLLYTARNRLATLFTPHDKRE